jgi:hypothetical protein
MSKTGSDVKGYFKYATANNLSEVVYRLIEAEDILVLTV